MPKNATKLVEQRSHALREFGLLKPDFHALFDQFTELAARLCDAPLAALSFNDHSRECFVSCFGFSLDKIPSGKGFSDYILSGEIPLLINDTRTDSRFRNAPLLQTDVAPRFYAGVPIMTAEGVPVGTLAVLDRMVRHLPQTKLDALQTLGKQVTLLLESMRTQQSTTGSSKISSGVQVSATLDKVFQALPGRHMLVEPEGMTVVALSKPVVAVFSTEDNAIGRPINELLHAGRSNDDLRKEAEKIFASFQRVARTGKSDLLPALRYSLPVPAEKGGGFEEHYWNIVNAPVHDADGRLVYIINFAEKVTELVRLRARQGKIAEDWKELENRAEKLEADVLARAREMERLNEHLHMAQDVANVGSWELDISDSSLFMSDAMFVILGIEPGQHAGKEDAILAATHPDDRKTLEEQRTAAIKGKSALDITHRIVRADGSIRFVWQQSRTVHDQSGKTVKLYGTLQDVTRQKEIEDELHTRARQQKVVASLGQKALSGVPLQELWDEAVETVAQTFDVEYCKVLELLPNGQEVKLVAGVGWKDGLVGHATVGTDLDSQAGYTLLEKGSVIVEDLRSETRFNGPPLLHDHGVVSGISMIIAGEKGPWGVLGAHTTRLRPFTQDDVNFFESVANILAEATQRARGAQEAADRSARQEALSRLTQSALRGTDLEELQALAAQLVTDVLKVEYSSIEKRLPDQKGIAVVAGEGWKEGVVGRAVLACGDDSYAGYVFTTMEPVVIVDLPNDERFRPSPLLLEHDIDSSVCLPIVDENDPWGLLCVFTPRRRIFTEEEVRFLQAIADVLVEVID